MIIQSLVDQNYIMWHQSLSNNGSMMYIARIIKSWRRFLRSLSITLPHWRVIAVVVVAYIVPIVQRVRPIVQFLVVALSIIPLVVVAIVYHHLHLIIRCLVYVMLDGHFN